MDLLTPGAAPASAPRTASASAPRRHPEEPDGWWRGEVNGRFSGQSAVGKVVERYPTQGVQYPFVGRDAALRAALAHAVAALDGFSQPATGSSSARAPPPPRAAPAFAYRARRRRRARRVAPRADMRLRFSRPL